MQVYLSALGQLVDKSSLELKLFDKTELLSLGASETLAFTLHPKDLASFADNQSRWIAEKGYYQVWINSSSFDIQGTADFQLKKEMVVEKVNVLFEEIKEFEVLEKK